jgi:hypothetical protein
MVGRVNVPVGKLQRFVGPFSQCIVAAPVATLREQRVAQRRFPSILINAVNEKSNAASSAAATVHRAKVPIRYMIAHVRHVLLRQQF